jgi:hypothetical protein
LPDVFPYRALAVRAANNGDGRSRRLASNHNLLEDALLNEPLSRPGIRWVLLVVIYFLVASASYCGYFTKWQFRDETPEFALPGMLDGTIERPFVYRQLLPVIANGVEHALPAGVRNRVNTLLFDDNRTHHPIAWFYPNATDARNPQYALRYYLIYGMSFAALLLAMFALRAVCVELQSNRIAATLAPMAFAVILPLILTDGAYFYDLPELLFMALAIWLSLRGRVFWLIVITALATLNKETFLVYVLTLFPFLRTRLSTATTLKVQFVLVAIAAAINALIKLKYAHNDGGVVQFHLMENLGFLVHPSSYLRFEYNYGVVMTKGFNLINIFIVAVLVRTAWSKLSPVVRQHLWIAIVINVPLFLAFGFHDELRNLSMLNVGFVIILCVNIAAYLDRGYRAVPAGEAPPGAIPVVADSVGERATVP